MQVIAEEHYGLKKCLLSLNVFLAATMPSHLVEVVVVGGTSLITLLKAQALKVLQIHVFLLSCYSMKLVENESLLLEHG